MRLPERFESVEHLEEVMTAPSAALVADLERAPGDILLLGVGGKMGPTLVRLAKRAVPKREVIDRLEALGQLHAPASWTTLAGARRP